MSDKQATLDRLQSFIHILEANNVIKSSSPIYELIGHLQRSKKERGLTYRLDNLVFNKIAKNQFIRHDKWDSSSFSVQLNLDVSIKTDGNFKFGDVNDSVVEIVYEVICEETYNYARGAWHLDYHAHKEPSESIHPSYHFHFGGRKIKDAIDNYGELAILDTPRIMHPPLDFFLAVDFMVTNFLETRAWQELRADDTYKKIIIESQKNWWKEYFQQISDYWEFTTNGADDISKRSFAKLSNPHLY